MVALATSSGGDVFAAGAVELPLQVFTTSIQVIAAFPVFEPSERSARELAATVELPAGAFVQQATLEIAARAPGTTPIGDVAEVRPGDAANSYVVDFHGLRTVAAVSVSAGITSVQTWQGTNFGDGQAARGAPATLSFEEILTERLLVTTARAAELESGTVDFRTPPADLDLSVAGARVWFHAGPALGGPAYRETVDVTAAVQAAVDAGAPGSVVAVPVRLASSVPGVLELTPTVSFLKTHEARFAEGPTRAVERGAEGEQLVAVPLPASAVTDPRWRIGQVQVRVKGSVGPQRVLPPSGPPTYDDLHLTLVAGRALLARLPRAHLDRLATLDAVRLLLQPGASGLELGGVLHGEQTTGPPGPGPVLDDVAIRPVVFPAPPAGAAPTWVTLPFAAPFDLERGRALWLELQVARGTAIWPLVDTAALAAQLAEPAGRWPLPGAATPAADDVRARLVRRIGQGRTEPPSAPGGLSTDSAALRVVGTPPANDPLDALDVAVFGHHVPLTPTADGVLAVVTLPSGTLPPVAAAEADGAARIDVTLVAAAPGAFTVGPVTVAYRDDPAGS